MGRIRRGLSEDAYLSRMDALHRESRKGRRVECHFCRKEFAQGSLAVHLARQHGIYHANLLTGEEEAEEMCTLVLTKPAVCTGVHCSATGKLGCPVPGCPQGFPGKGAGSSWDLRWHFAFRHAPDRILVTGNNWFPCRLCRVQTAAAGTPAHKASKMCRYMWALWNQHASAARGGRSRVAPKLHGAQ